MVTKTETKIERVEVIAEDYHMFKHKCEDYEHQIEVFSVPIFILIGVRGSPKNNLHRL